MRRGFPERSSQPRSHRRVSKSHLAEESATTFSWRFFLLPPPPRRCNPSVLGPLSPSPAIPLSLRSPFPLPSYFFFLPYFSSFSSSTAGFLFWSLILRGEDAASNLRGFERKSSFPRWRSSLFCSSVGPDSGAYGSVSFPRVPASNLIPADRCRDLARILPPFRV